MLFQLENRDLPERYRLMFDADSGTIRFALEPNIALGLNRFINSGHPEIKELEKGLNISELSSNIKNAWGYGSVIQPITAIHGWPAWQAILPLVIRPGHRPSRQDWERAYNVSASLGLAFLFLHYENCLSEAKTPQLLAVHFCSRPLAADIFCELSPRGVNLLKTMDRDDLDSIETALGQAYECMHTGAHTTRFSVTMREDGFFYMEVPGDACGLGTGFNQNFAQGASLTPHNVDSPIQQLTLLAGLARLDSILRHRSSTP